MVGVPFLEIEMRLRAVGADRLALALAQPQMVDDPGPEQEHEQRAGHHRAAGAEGDVAKHVEERGTCHRPGPCWKARSANKTFRSALYRGFVVRGLAGKRLSSALTIGFIFEPSEPLIMMASPARIAPSTCDSSAAEVSA